MSRRTRQLSSLGLALLLIGCQPGAGPTGVRPPRPSASPKVQVQSSPAPGASSTPIAIAPSIAPPVAPVIGNNGGSLVGVVKAPASLLSNNGGNVVSNGGGNYRLQATVEQVPVAGVAVLLKDAAGNVVGETKTGADGKYGFTAALPTQNLILEVALPNQKGTVQAIVPKEGTGPKTVDADLVSTLTTGYILSQFVKGQQNPVATLDKLPAAVEQATRAKAQSAFAGGTAAVPEALTESKVIAVVNQLREQDKTFDAQMEEVKKLLVVGSATAAITDGDALEALLYEPNGMAFGPDGHLYIADTRNALVRKLTPDGQIATVAGTGALETKDGPIATAGFRQPLRLGFDKAGNMYVGEWYTVRKITPEGVVSTLAGGKLETTRDGKGAEAGFYALAGLAVTPDGTVYVKDGPNIRKVTADGTVTSLGYTGNSVAADQAGNYYVGTGPDIWKKPPTGASTTIVLKGASIWPYHLAVSPAGTLYVASFSEVGRVAADGTVTKLAEGGKTYTDPKVGEFKLGDIAAIAADDDGNVYTSSNLNHQVYKIASDGTVSVAAGSGKQRQQDGSGTEVLFNHLFSVAIAPDGQTLVADTYNHMIRKIDGTGKVSLVAGTGKEGHDDGPGPSATFIKPTGLLVSPEGVIYVSEAGRIRKIASDGTVSTLTADPLMSFPYGMAFDADGNLIVAMGGMDGFPDRRILKVTPAGAVTILIQWEEARGDNNLWGPHDVLVEPDGSMLVADSDNNQIRRILTDGTITTFAGATESGTNDGPLTTARFYKPFGLARGTDGSLYVADMWNHKIRKIKDGVVSTLPITGLNYPTEVTLTPDGRLAVADGGNRQVKFFDLP